VIESSVGEDLEAIIRETTIDTHTLNVKLINGVGKSKYQ